MNIVELFFLMAATAAILYYVMVYIPEQHRKEISKKVGDLAKLHRRMDQLRDKTSIQRILILKSHNGDGIPKMGYQIKVTALYESYETPFKNVVNDYQDLRVDGDYIKMLTDVQMYGQVAMWTHEMNHSLLRTIYESEGVTWSYIFPIGQDSRNWYYCSLALHGSKSPFDLNQGAQIELFKNYLKNEYKKLNKTKINRIREAFHI